MVAKNDARLDGTRPPQAHQAVLLTTGRPAVRTVPSTEMELTIHRTDDRSVAADRGDSVDKVVAELSAARDGTELAAAPQMLRQRTPWLVRTANGVVDALVRNRRDKEERAQHRRARVEAERARQQAAATGSAPVRRGGYRFKRSGIHVAYLISLAMSGYGQTRFFAQAMNVSLALPDVVQAAIGAVFLELTMVGADGYSMYHRQRHPEGGWLLIRCFAWIVAGFGAWMNFQHFGTGPHANSGLAWFFAAATVAGFTLEDITGHLKVRIELSAQGWLPAHSQIGFLRWIVYRGAAFEVWKRLVAEPAGDVDEQFRLVLAERRQRKDEPAAAGGTPSQHPLPATAPAASSAPARNKPALTSRRASTRAGPPGDIAQWAGQQHTRPSPSAIRRQFPNRPLPGDRQIRRWTKAAWGSH